MLFGKQMDSQHIHIYDREILKSTGYTCWKCYEADQERKHKLADREYQLRILKIVGKEYGNLIQPTAKQLKSLLRRNKTTA